MQHSLRSRYSETRSGAWTHAAGKGKEAERPSTSGEYQFWGGTIPSENVVQEADFVLLHGNGVSDPAKITDMVTKTRAVAGYRPMPIVFNEDDHFDFDKPMNNFVAATQAYASWGIFDYRMKNEGFDDGYQSVPVNWGISSPRKQGFFGLLKAMTVPDKSTSGKWLNSKD